MGPGSDPARRRPGTEAPFGRPGVLEIPRAECPPDRLRGRPGDQAPGRRHLRPDRPLRRSEKGCARWWRPTAASCSSTSPPRSRSARLDGKGLYARARAGMMYFTGVSDPYEPPADADIVVDTTRCTSEEAAESILEHLRARGIFAKATTGRIDCRRNDASACLAPGRLTASSVTSQVRRTASSAYCHRSPHRWIRAQPKLAVIVGTLDLMNSSFWSCRMGRISTKRSRPA